jgi:hypothetical protein
LNCGFQDDVGAAIDAVETRAAEQVALDLEVGVIGGGPCPPFFQERPVFLQGEVLEAGADLAVDGGADAAEQVGAEGCGTAAEDRGAVLVNRAEMDALVS